MTTTTTEPDWAPCEHTWRDLERLQAKVGGSLEAFYDDECGYHPLIVTLELDNSVDPPLNWIAEASGDGEYTLTIEQGDTGTVLDPMRLKKAIRTLQELSA